MTRHDDPVAPEGTRVSDIGDITIGNEVIAAVAARAGAEIAGVTITSTGVAGNIAKVLGRKGPARGIRVTNEGGGVILDLKIAVQFGLRIPDAAELLQRKVKKAVEEMSGIGVQAVNVAVVGITDATPMGGESI